MAREMKDSGIEWIGMIPRNWNCKKLKYILASPLMYGANESGEEYNEEYPRYIRITDIDDNNELKEDGKLSLLPVIARPYILQDNDILFARSGASVGKTFLYKKIYGKAAFAGYLIKAHLDVLMVVPKYVYYSTLSIGYDNWKNSIFTQATIQNIGADKYSNYQVSIPTINEQKRIIDFLDKKCGEIDVLSSDIQSQINILEDYKKSVITEAVTKGVNLDVEMKDSGIEWIKKIPISWDKARIGYNSWIRARLGWKGLKAEEYVDDGYAFLSAFNIVNNKLDWNNLNYITQERYDESPEIKLCIGDIILVKDGAGIGKCAKIDTLPVGEATTNGSLAVISTYDNLNYRYLYYYLQSAMFQNYIFRIMNGMGVPHLSQEELRKITVPVPPLEEQNDIADYLEKKCIEIDAAIDEKKEQLETLEQYKKSLIYEYVTGKKEV